MEESKGQRTVPVAVPVPVPVRSHSFTPLMKPLFHRRIAAEDGDQSPSMSPQLLFSKVVDRLRTITGHHAEKPKTKEQDESRQDLQQYLSAASEDKEDNWRNDFLSPGSAISKQNELRKPPRSFPSHERSHQRDHTGSPTSNDPSSFTESQTSSERSSERASPRDVGRSSSENISPHQALHPHHSRHWSMPYIGHEENHSPPSRSHRRSNTFSSSTRPCGHNRSSSFTIGRQQRRQSPPSLTLDSLYSEMQHRRQHFGPCGYKVGQTWNLIGNAHFRRKEHDKAMSAYEQALDCVDGCEKSSDFDHVADAYGNLGTVCWSTGDMERSMTCIRKVLELRMESEISKGRDPCESLTVATSYYQLGLALTLHRDYKKALDALFDALDIQQKLLGRKSIDVARTLDSIGKVHLLQGDADQSMAFHQEAFATKYGLTGECRPLVITSLTNIAAAHLARNEEKEAILAYLAIRNAQSFELHKTNDPGTSALLAMEAGETIQMLVDLYTKTGAYQSAKLAADEALGLYQKAGISKDHPKMEALKQSVKILYSKALS